MTQCKTNNWITNGSAISIQIMFVFAFLTVFFFVFVQKVEKEEFVSQMNIIVDDIMEDIGQEFSNLVKEKSIFNTDNEDSLIIISGIIDLVQDKISLEAKNDIEYVLENNHQVKLKAFKSLMSFITIIVVLITILFLFGFCIPIQYQIKEAMLIVIFVGLTELAFLKVITQNYISASPNKVKRSFAQAIQTWINNNHKIKNK